MSEQANIISVSGTVARCTLHGASCELDRLGCEIDVTHSPTCSIQAIAWTCPLVPFLHQAQSFSADGGRDSSSKEATFANVSFTDKCWAAKEAARG
jgi:hypothetical protein